MTKGIAVAYWTARRGAWYHRLGKLDSFWSTNDHQDQIEESDVVQIVSGWDSIMSWSRRWCYSY